MVIYEINGHVWLTQLREKYGSRLTLGAIPEIEFDQFRTHGFTHIWLMGVWTTGPKSLEMARSFFSIQAADLGLDPSFDIIASPFSISDYRVSPSLGSDEDLRKFRSQLQKREMRLILDAVFNHLGLDHPLVLSHPEYFVSIPSTHPAASPQKGSGDQVLAHGKDPYFPPWRDTYQLDATHKGCREWLLSELLRIASFCDGVRCDMAMLLCPDTLRRTWGQNLSDPNAPGFWRQIIEKTKSQFPQFEFLAEVYWDLEQELLADGFDHVYDKVFYDSIVEDRFPAADIIARFSKLDYATHAVIFLENHDEQRFAKMVTDPLQYIAAHYLLLGIPGIALLHHGQMEAKVERTPVQFNRWPVERGLVSHPGPAGSIVKSFAEHQVRKGLGRFEENLRGGGDPLFCMEWEESETVKWVVVNYGPSASLGEWGRPEFVTYGTAPKFLFFSGTMPEDLSCPDSSVCALRLPAWGCAVLEWAKSY